MSIHSYSDLRLHLQLLAGLFVFWGVQVQATITINSVQGASAYIATTGTVTQNTTTIYGGSAGDMTQGNCNQIAGQVATCSNCIAGTARTAPCNINGVTDASVLQVQFSSNSASGFPSINFTGSSSGTLAGGGTGGSCSTNPTPVNVSTNVNQGSTATVSYTWGTLCQSGCLADSSGNPLSGTACGSAPTGAYTASVTAQIQDINQNPLDTSNTITLNFVRLNNDSALALSSTHSGSVGCTANSNATQPPADISGICYFELTPGDQKANVQNVLGDVNFSSGDEFASPAIPFTSVRFFYYQAASSTFDSTQFANIDPFNQNTTSNFDISIPSNTNSTTQVGTASQTISLGSSRITGLSNGGAYYMKSAMVDQAGNVGFLTADSDDTNCDPAFPTTGPPLTGQCHFVTPSQVLGILANDINCFIATAAYGGPYAPQVQLFREFRNKCLLPSELGRTAVRFYYQNSPKYARIIAGNESLRAGARVLLAPALLYAWLALKIGTIPALLIVLLLFASLAYYAARWIARARSHARTRTDSGRDATL